MLMGSCLRADVMTIGGSTFRQTLLTNFTNIFRTYMVGGTGPNDIHSQNIEDQVSAKTRWNKGVRVHIGRTHRLNRGEGVTIIKVQATVMIDETSPVP